MAGLTFRDAARLSDDERLDELASLLAVGAVRLLGSLERNALDESGSQAALCVRPVDVSENPGMPGKETRR